MSELFQFFVSFEIKEEYGTNVENEIQDTSMNVIGHKAKYKFRVRYDTIPLYCKIVKITSTKYHIKNNEIQNKCYLFKNSFRCSV